MTEEFVRHMRPDRVLGVDCTSPPESGPLPNDWSIYGDDLTEVWRPIDLTEDRIRTFFRGLDVCWMAETDYQPHRHADGPSVLDLAHEEGCRTVMHAMPELWRWRNWGDRQPDLTLVPTGWYPPAGAEVFPFPVALDRFTARTRIRVDCVLHILGTNAMLDRNGTRIVAGAAPLIDRPVTIRSEVAIPLPSVPNVGMEVFVANRYWQVYDGCDLLVLPRRYAGQSLPMLEAAACGMPVVCLDREPENGWFGSVARCFIETHVPMIGGTYPVYSADPNDVAATVNAVIAAPREFSEQARAFAEANSWDVLFGRFHDLLAAHVSA